MGEYSNKFSNIKNFNHDNLDQFKTSLKSFTIQNIAITCGKVYSALD